MIDDVLATLERTPAVLSALLDGLPDDVVLANEGPGTWSPRDIVVHFLVGEKTDWVPRARIILEHGTTRPFDPFVRAPPVREEPLDELLREFAALRRANIDRLRAWDPSPDDLARRGLHPELGEVTLGELVATWAAHDLGHIRQIARVLAKRYADRVGPWSQYLPVVRERGGDSGA
ncbi:MAG: DinB family protein [Planctomycetota bacterium]|nr:DinB family protein [Planctomycetota bacterium]